MNVEIILEVLNKLIGEINPVGETNIDNERFNNLMTLCSVTESLLYQITQNSIDNKDRSEYSIKRSGEYANEFLRNLKL